MFNVLRFSFKASNVKNICLKMFLFGLFYFVGIFIIFSVLINVSKKHEEKRIKTIEKKSNMSEQDICNIMECASIKDSNGILLRIDDNTYSKVKEDDTLLNNIVKKFFSVEVFSSNKRVKYTVELNDLASNYFSNMIVFFTCIIILFLYFLVSFSIFNSKKILQDGAGNTALLYNKNMSMFAEHLFHELNTPLSVTKELCDKTFDEMGKSFIKCSDSLKTEECKTCTIPKRYLKVLSSKDIINNNINQAFVFIRRMANAKDVKYSNGNKTLYDIIKSTMDLMLISNRTNYTYNIDEEFKKYRINHSSGLKNYELMNILVNHIKNSLDAASSHIDFSLNKVVKNKDTKKDKFVKELINISHNKLKIKNNSVFNKVLNGFLSDKSKKDITIVKLAFLDNGSGIPESFQDKVFKLNSSTKIKDGQTRGAGLYLNREILRACYGDLLLYKTGKKGTIFILDIPAEKTLTK